MELQITLVIAAAAALLNIWLAMRVGRMRTAHKISVGDGGNEQVIRRMRAHANFTEYTPFFLILLALIELAVGSSTWLWAVAILFILGRISHAFGMDGIGKLRIIGILTTTLVLLGMAIWAIVIAYSGMAFTGTELPGGIAA